MAEYLAPGVYVEEVERGAAPLAGVSTSTAGFLGETERGPTEPRLLTSFADYRRTFGSHLELDDSYLAHAVEGFFANGGSRCFVGRITSDDHETATATLPLERPVEYRGSPLLAADTLELDFGDVSATTTADVTLTHEGDEDDDPIEIIPDEHVTVETTPTYDDVFTVTWEDGTDSHLGKEVSPEGSGVDLQIAFDPESGIRFHWGLLTIDVGGGIEPVRVIVFGNNDSVPANSDLDVEVEIVDFGVVDQGADASAEITIENSSGGDIDIKPGDSRIVGRDVDDFKIDESSTFQIQDSEEGEFSVDFVPEDPVGPKEAMLLIEHDGTNSPLVIPLQGVHGSIGIEAVGPGTWGDQVAILVEDASLYEPGDNELFKLVVRYWSDPGEYEAAKDGQADVTDDDVPEPDVEEVFDDISPHESSNSFFVNQIEGVSMLIETVKRGKGRPDPNQSPIWLDGGVDADVDRGDFEGDNTDPAEERTGLAGFETLDEIAIVCIPDEHAHGATDLVVTHCENMDDRFAILQADQNPGQASDLKPPENSDMAAFYYPWLEVIDPTTGSSAPVPPGGHVAGIYARTDANRGVHKAPANEVVRGIQGLQRTITKGEQEILNPRGVNCIRAMRGRGIRVWGARTTSSNPYWKYVNVRRLFLFLRGSIEEGTQWVVFEPNNEQLWARVEQTIKNFLTDVWEDGALMGTSPEEAFFVTCDRSTMTQSDIEQGRLICEIGVAPTRPAEFVIFRISQWTAEGG